MKIIITCSAPGDKGSGILTYCKNLILSCINLGHEVLFICQETSNKEWFENNNVSFFEFSINNEVVSELRRIKEKIDTYSPDIIINNDNCYVQQLAPVINSKFVVVGHLANYAIGSLLNLNEKYVDQYVAISTDMKFDMIKKYQIPSEKIIVVHNGLFNQSQKSEIIKSKKIENSQIIALYGGENSKRKGADKFIRLLDRTPRSSNLSYIWTINNDCIEKRKLLAISKYNVNITGRLEFNNFKKTLKSAHVLLMPSREEGCPMLLLEAMSYGIIPIVSDGTGAMKEIIKHGVNGYICSLHNWHNEVYEILISEEFEKNYDLISKNTKLEFDNNYSNNEFLIKILERSSVDKCTLQKGEIFIYDWHRRANDKSNSFFNNIENRLRYRFGLLKKINRMDITKL